MQNPHQATIDFERALCEYTGAPYAVAVNSCTMALTLAVAWCIKKPLPPVSKSKVWFRPEIEIPKKTYVSVPMAIIHAGGRPTFRDEAWLGSYQLKPLDVFDSARRFTSGMYKQITDLHTHDTTISGMGGFVCVSFHASKILGDTQGGAILHDSPEADAWLRRARFDGRTSGVAPIDDTFTQIGWHCYLSPDVSARLLLKLYSLPKHNDDLPNDPYPDLSTLEVFQ